MDDQKQIIAKEKEALDLWSNANPDGFISNAADEITYFEPSLKTRLDGLDQFKKHLEPIRGQFTIPAYEMVNTKVQLHGEIGILTFNLNNLSKDGKVTSTWNSTEVYKKIGEEWKLIHSHWSMVKP